MARHQLTRAILLSIGSAACTTTVDVNLGGNLEPPTSVRIESSEGGARLTWVDISQEFAFEIERKPEGSDWQLLTTVPFDTTQYVDANLLPGVSYTYRVVAVSKDGKHGYSSSDVQFSQPLQEAGVDD